MGNGEFMSGLQSALADFLGASSPEFLLFALSVGFFGFSAGLCAMAVRAALGVREAHDDARIMLQTVQNYAVEVRQLASKTEQVALRGGDHEETLSERIRSVRVGSRLDSGEASVAIESNDEHAGEELVATSEDIAVSAVEGQSNHAAGDASGDDSGGESDFLKEEANARLIDANRAATEPRSLLSGLLRRR